MLKVGLTGGIASGKSEAARAFADLGVPVVDSDDLAREATTPGSAGLAAIVTTFGPEILGADGELDRKKLRTRVFNDSAARERLEQILHPRVRALLHERLDALAAPYVIIVVPLLVETDMAREMDRVLVVDCPEAAQIARLRARDGETEAGARAILAAQAGRAERLTAADDVITNDSSLDRLESRVRKLDQHYRQAQK